MSGYGRQVTRTDDFPRRRAVTRGFRLGQPRTITVAAGGARVLFLRSLGPTDPVNCLWAADLLDGTWRERLLVDVTALSATGEDLPPEERAKRERLREVSGGITAYTDDDAVAKVAFVLSGRLWVHDLATGATRAAGTGTTYANAAMDPTGRRVAVTSGPDVVVMDLADGSAQPLLTPDGPAVSWGAAEFVAAEEMGRYAGLWWAPDGESLLVARVDETAVPTWWIADPAQPGQAPVAQRYPAAGTSNAAVSLHLVDLARQTTPVAWDAERYEYLTAVDWRRDGDPVLAVQDRAQRELVVLTMDPASGGTTEVWRDTDEHRVELVAGLPRRIPDGVAVTRVDRGADTRRLVLLDVAGRERVATPDGMQLRSVTSHDDDGIVFTACEADASTVDLWRMSWDGDLTRLSDPGGWATGLGRDGTVVVARADAEELTTTLTVHRAGTGPRQIPSLAETPDLIVLPDFLADDSGWHHIAVLWPSTDHTEPLPIVLSPYGGPHAQRSIRAAGSFATEQWLADQGVCVVVADGPGSPSRPSNEDALYRDLASGPLQGQVAALGQVVRRYGDRVDPTRVGIRGWSFGGYLAALAVLERPDVFHAAVAGAPVTDWQLYDTHYTERYLGRPDTDADAYARSSLLTRAAQLRRPLLLVHGLADDNVVAAHTLRLSSALLAAGRQHSVLPLSGVTHMTPQESVTENLLRLELTFLRHHLHP